MFGFFSSYQNVYTYSTSFYNSFNKLGYETCFFNCKKTSNFFSFYFLNSSLLRKVEKVRPDLIFIVKSNNISYKTIKKIKENFHSYIVNFYPDNPFVFWNGNSNLNVLNSLPIYDCFLIWSKMLVPVLESVGSKKTYYFPFGFDCDLFSKKLIIKDDERKKYKCDVCFIGTWDKQREDWLTKLCSKMPELNLAIWGNLWKEKIANNSILQTKIRGCAVYNNEMRKAFYCSKIVLNFIREQNATSHNMRTFEVTANGSFLLTQRTIEQSDYLFKENRSVACFDSVDELKEKILFYLNNDEARNSAASMGKIESQKFELQILLEKFMIFMHTCVCDQKIIVNKKDVQDEFKSLKTKDCNFNNP